MAKSPKYRRYMTRTPVITATHADATIQITFSPTDLFWGYASLTAFPLDVVPNGSLPLLPLLVARAARSIVACCFPVIVVVANVKVEPLASPDSPPEFSYASSVRKTRAAPGAGILIEHCNVVASH